MPITLETPVVRPAVVNAEVVRFHVDLINMAMLVGLQYSTEDGEIVKQEQVPVKLLNAEGVPRFTGAEYTSIKQAIYRLLLEDGAVSGEVS